MAVANIPVLDISDPSQDEVRVARDLVEAAIEHGFIYIKNTGGDIPIDAVQGAFHLSKELFAAPLEEKQQCRIQKNNKGWAGMQYESLDPKNQRSGDFKETFNFGEFASGQPQQPIPPSITHHTSQIDTFYDHCYNLTLKLNHLLGIGLNVNPPTFFRDAHLRANGASSSILRLLYYPSLPMTTAQPEANVRAGAHSDYGSLTMLFRLPRQPGLEILLPSNKWVPVPVSPPGTGSDPAPPILVNIGDLLSYWTNGLLRSTVHRVVFNGGENSVKGETDTDARYSIAYFCHPVGTLPLTAVPSERVKGFKGKGGVKEEGEEKVLTADEHLMMRYV
ncbi:2OG-Fe(II) oxygenase superfamily protein [Immersiella caudata]|uniref:2OG-Fe(II) oxygenase superfamily protein n=1 Tax=Immersiella caudata TaxID=314043 RepID=A0AA39X339_9PEZI|nr:2OG-Fe(II) oxygenase superfamily protein [Immersiella caudata]